MHTKAPKNALTTKAIIQKMTVKTVTLDLSEIQIKTQAPEPKKIVVTIFVETALLRTGGGQMGGAEGHVLAVVNMTTPDSQLIRILTGDDEFNLCKEIMIMVEQATKIYNNKKATVVVLNCAQAISGQEARACRTVSGRSGPKKETTA
ncbi:hypothetical protein MRX96_007763 [Rhipicephalus microplus]